MESIEPIRSLESKLQISCICSIRIRARNRDIFKTLHSALLRIKSLPLKKYLTQTTSTIQWRVWLREVNLQTLINTFDALLCEGPKIKFRFGLAYLGLLIKTGELDKIKFLSFV